MSDKQSEKAEAPKAEAPKAKPVKRLSVRLLETKGSSSLVEWQDASLHRGYIPAKEVDADGTVPAPVLDEAILYGIAWEKHITLSATAEALADALRRRGIWTARDLQTKQQAALGAIISVYTVDLGALNKAAHKEA